MMKTAVIYATRTKHSARLAEAIGTALHTKAENIATHPDLGDVDLLFIVGGIYGGVSMPELLAYAEELDPQKVRSAALVTSCASGRQQQTGLRKILEKKGIPVVDEFICRGAILFVSAGHPNALDLKNTAEFAVRIR